MLLSCVHSILSIGLPSSCWFLGPADCSQQALNRTARISSKFSKFFCRIGWEIGPQIARIKVVYRSAECIFFWRSNGRRIARYFWRRRRLNQPPVAQTHTRTQVRVKNLSGQAAAAATAAFSTAQLWSLHKSSDSLGVFRFGFM